MRKLEKEIAQITVSHSCTLYGFADLQGYTPGKLAKFHRGISFVFQMDAWACDRYKKTISINFTVVTTAASAPRPVRWGKRCFANTCDSVGFHGSLP
jgi:hypothetical protein